MTELSKNTELQQSCITAVMRSAFYTPTLEEFHVGFECEWQCKIRNETWNKQICDIDLINIAYDAIEHADEEEPFEEQFRVKYLNKEDFENLNFTREFATMSDILKTGCEVYKNDTLNLNIAHYKELNKISICTIDFSKNKTKSSWDENQVNLITAKNKSELQYILIRLGFSQADA